MSEPFLLQDQEKKPKTQKTNETITKIKVHPKIVFHFLKFLNANR